MPIVSHKHGFLMGYKHAVCNTGDSRYDSSLKRFFIYVGNFYNSENSNFSFLTCYSDACRYIKIWIVDNAINTWFGMFLYGFEIVNVG